MTEENCKNCRFWIYRVTTDRDDGRGKRDRGHCRRKPPQVVTEEDGAVTTFPFIAGDEWCGKHEPTRDKLRTDARDAQIKSHAGELLKAARAAVAGEAEHSDDDWPLVWRSPVVQIGARIARKMPDLQLQIWSLARERAAEEPKVLEVLNWAALDTAFAEATA